MTYLINSQQLSYFILYISYHALVVLLIIMGTYTHQQISNTIRDECMHAASEGMAIVFTISKPHIETRWEHRGYYICRHIEQYKAMICTAPFHSPEITQSKRVDIMS